MSLKTKYLPGDLTAEERFVQGCQGAWSLGCGAAKTTIGESITKAGYGCHAWMFHGAQKYEHIVTQYNGSTPEAVAFLEWLTKADGPFKALWDIGGGAIILSGKDGYPVAISLGKKQSLFEEFGLIMSLMIMSRVPKERTTLLKSWYVLTTKYKMDPALAYYMCKGAVLMNEKTLDGDWITWPGITWNGGHEVFSEIAGYQMYGKPSGVVDIKGFAKGEFRKAAAENYLSSIIWNEFKDKKFLNRAFVSFPFQMYAKQEKVGFGTSNVLKPSSIPKLIVDFTAFVESRYEKA